MGASLAEGIAPLSVKEFLTQPAANITVDGQYTIANWFDSKGKPGRFACRTSRVSPSRMMIAVPVAGSVGDLLTSDFADLGEFGNLEGHSSDTAKGALLVELTLGVSMR